jgi:thiosulfate/3-mercaptopyruvate sulfurtransferase
MWATAITAVAMAADLCAQDADARSRLLVSADWLALHMTDPELVLLHVGDRDDYDAEHIPGAHYTSHRDLSDANSTGPNALTLELPDPVQLQAKLREFGISDDSRIVVYWGSEWVSPAARVVFTLAWAGLEANTALLDGGIDAWKAAGYPVTAEATLPTEGDITVEPQDHLVVDAAWVQSHSTEPGYQLVDGRNAEFFGGTREDRGKAGHIPGAGNVMWRGLLDDSLRLKDSVALREAFAAAGIEPHDIIVAYCHIGQYATMVMFVARTLGHDVMLYDGAFQDWAQRDLPVEKPEP